MQRRNFLGLALGALIAPSLIVKKPIELYHHFGRAQDYLINARLDELKYCHCLYHTTDPKLMFKAGIKEVIKEKDKIVWVINNLNVNQVATFTGVSLITPDGLNITSSITKGNIARFYNHVIAYNGDALKVVYTVDVIGGTFKQINYH